MLHFVPQSVARIGSIYAVSTLAIALALSAGRPCGAATLGHENAPVQSTGLETKRFNESRIAAALDEKTELDFAETPLGSMG